MAKVDIKILSSCNEICNLRYSWNSLKPAMNYPFLRWEWIYTAAKAFHSKEKLQLVVAKKGSRMMGVAPMVLAKEPYGKHLRFIGIEKLHEPCGLVYENFSTQKIIVNTLKHIGLPIILERLDGNRDSHESIYNLIKGWGWTIRKDTVGTCFLKMNGYDFQSFLTNLPSKRRYDLRRLERRAKQANDVDCRIFNPKPDELENCLEKVFEIEARNWKGRRGSAIKYNPEMAFFFRQFCEYACEDGYLRIAMLSFQGKTAAVMIGAELGGRFWVFKIGYDERWSRYSPGLVLINETVKYAFEQGLNAYEFLGSDEPWIHLWSGKKNIHKKFLIAFYPCNLNGIYRFCRDGGRVLYNKIKYRMRD